MIQRTSASRGGISFEDERLWATSRIRWYISRWWALNKPTIAIGLILITALLYVLYHERERRLVAENEAIYMAAHIAAMSCYEKDQPSSLVLAGGSKESLNKALLDASMLADKVRVGWLVAEGVNREQTKY